MTAVRPRIGWIGLGKMGTPICRRLKAAGYEVTAHVRNQSARQRAEEIGVACAESVANVARAADIVFSCLSDDDALRDVVLGQSGLSSCLRYGQTFIDTSTVSPAVSGEIADALAERGVSYLRAPISGSTTMAEAGQVTVILSGSLRDYTNLQPVFESFSTRQFLVGHGDEARHMKLTINSMLGAMSALVAEAIAFGVKGGLDIHAMLEVMNASAVASPLLRYKTEQIAQDDFTPAFTVNQMMKDLDLFLAVGRQEHCPLPLAAFIRQQFEAAYASGEGESDFFVLTRQALALSGIKKAEPDEKQDAF
jgi:3-hydroxyisobutyrate dehydrogenase-like beta-hydroxyacid dehydrogenase